MHEVVRTDPPLAARILRVVNSAFYGLPSQIASLDRAILMLGLSAVKNVALAASLLRLFRAEAVAEQFAARDLWRHSLAVGVCARLLAAQAGLPEEEAFVAGLVHDLGLIIVQQLFPQKLKAVAEACLDTSQDFCTGEEDFIGADHQAFGSALAAKWKFPPALRYAIACHHCPDYPRISAHRITAIVYTADTICSRERYGFWLTARTQEISELLLEALGLSSAALEPLVGELAVRVDEAGRIFSE
jgi:putative nucleotidyltransferase with HDIG domain